MPHTSVQPTIIGVCGGVGSGKSTAVRSITQLVGAEKVSVLPHDNYFKSQDHVPLEERSKTNYDHPDSLETTLYIEHLKALKKGESVQMPQYDFATHNRTQKTVTVEAKPIILLDGILLFDNEELRNLCDLKIYVDTDPDVRLARRLLRDVAERGRTYESCIEQHLLFTRPMHLEFVEPSKRYADLIIPEGGMSGLALNVISAHIQALIAEFSS